MTRRLSNSALGKGRLIPRQHIEAPIEHQIRTQGGVIVCPECKAVHHDKHWYTADEIVKIDRHKKKEGQLCPGCHRRQLGLWLGDVTLAGVAAENRDAMLSLIAHVEDKCWHDNPISRICSLEERGDRIEIKTTSEWLASRIGKEIHKAYKGHLDLKRLPERKTIRVYWQSS